MQRTVITLSQKLIQLMMLPEQYLGKQAEIRLCDSTFNKSKDQDILSKDSFYISAASKRIEKKEKLYRKMFEYLSKKNL